MNDKSKWTQPQWLAFLDGWSYQRLGYPAQPRAVPHGKPNVMASAHRVAATMGADRGAVSMLDDALGVEAARPFYDLGIREASAA